MRRRVIIRPGQEYTFSWELQTQDHVFAAGHRIGLVLISTDRDYTLRYPAGTVVTTRLGLSNVSLPLSHV
jgi:X-Pro dipeptidyl-peptidase